MSVARAFSGKTFITIPIVGPSSLPVVMTQSDKRHVNKTDLCWGGITAKHNGLSSFEPDVVLCSVSVIPLQHRSCSVCMSFVRLGHHNG